MQCSCHYDYCVGLRASHWSCLNCQHTVLIYTAVWQTLGGLENGEASLGIQNNIEDIGAEAVADPISGEPLQEGSSNGAAEDAPAHEPGPVSLIDQRIHHESLHLTTVVYTSPRSLCLQSLAWCCLPMLQT